MQGPQVESVPQPKSANRSSASCLEVLDKRAAICQNIEMSQMDQSVSLPDRVRVIALQSQTIDEKGQFSREDFVSRLMLLWRHQQRGPSKAEEQQMELFKKQDWAVLLEEEQRHRAAKEVCTVD